MNYKMLFRINGQVLLMEAFFMLLPILISVSYGERHAALAFGEGLLICLITGLILVFPLSKGVKEGFYAREGLVVTGLCWIVMSAFGAIPFVLCGDIPSYIDAYFEMASGFTTTGASIIPNVELMSHGTLFWRNFSNWIGGMGVLVFLLAVLPGSGKETGFTLHILRAESPGPSVGKIVPKMRETALILYFLYIGLTILNIVFLIAGGMPAFDSVCHAMGTAGTGGFGVKADSFASYSPYIQNVTTVFMLLFGVNFSIYYIIVLKKLGQVFRDEEVRLYVLTVLAAGLLIGTNIRFLYNDWGETLRTSFFQVASMITTTGFATADFDSWPVFSKSLILLLMMIGACAGSTGGGMKCARVLILVKSLLRNIRKNIHPRTVHVLKINDRVISEDVIANTHAYFSAYMIIVAVLTVILSLDGFSIETNLSAALCTFNNIGPGLDKVGPTCNFAAYSDLSKLFLSFAMITGRLEIFPILSLFSRSTWKKM
ncbi:MAG: TrkH family potassium uptake protein [Lachnospiraceae bacterium]|nr:TrkH family potassium uptake protein [Lachnospiraceae bacterium]